MPLLLLLALQTADKPPELHDSTSAPKGDVMPGEGSDDSSPRVPSKRKIPPMKDDPSGKKIRTASRTSSKPQETPSPGGTVISNPVPLDDGLDSSSSYQDDVEDTENEEDSTTEEFTPRIEPSSCQDGYGWSLFFDATRKPLYSCNGWINSLGLLGFYSRSYSSSKQGATRATMVKWINSGVHDSKNNNSESPFPKGSPGTS